MNFAVSTETHIHNAVKFLIDLTLLDLRIYNFVVIGKENVKLGLVDWVPFFFLIEQEQLHLCQ